MKPPAASAPAIERSPAPPVPGARFSIVIPTWNNLPHLKLCLEGLRRNSTVPHEVILHVNEGIDGTREWVRQQGMAHTHSERNAGVCWGINAAAALARTPFVVYLNDDMYACPGWDSALWAAVEAVGHRRFFLSATMIEPGGKNRAAHAGHDFGRRSVLRMGQDYGGPLPEMESLPGYGWARLKARRYLFQP